MGHYDRPTWSCRDDHDFEEVIDGYSTSVVLIDGVPHFQVSYWTVMRCTNTREKTHRYSRGTYDKRCEVTERGRRSKKLIPLEDDA